MPSGKLSEDFGNRSAYLQKVANNLLGFCQRVANILVRHMSERGLYRKEKKKLAFIRLPSGKIIAKFFGNPVAVCKA